MSSNSLKVVKKEDEITAKEDRITDYIKSLVAIEEEMEPYKEHRRELRNDYRRQGWLTKEEMSVAVKAYRLMRGEVDLDALYETYSVLSTAANPDVGEEQ